MKRFAQITAAVAAATLAGTSVAVADDMVDAPVDGWRQFPTVLNDYHTPGQVTPLIGGVPAPQPFWDNPSSDVPHPKKGGPENIGNYLEGPFNSTITGPVSSPGITPEWWGASGNGTASMDLDEEFTRGGSEGAITATVLLESAGNRGRNVVGWYDADNPKIKHVLWNGKASPTKDATVTFTPTTNWGFYIVGARGTFYMDAADSSRDKKDQHFAVFQTDDTSGGEHYTVGVEDLPANSIKIEGTGDFNDFVLSFFSTPGGGGGTPPVPEPASLALLGGGALALLARRRR